MVFLFFVITRLISYNNKELNNNYIYMKRSQKAFTLIELLVVIAIISIIAVLGMVSLGNARMKARDAKRVADIKQVQVALEMFYNGTNRYPTQEEWDSGTIVATTTSGDTVYYLTSVPSAPVPADGNCSASDNQYSYVSTGDSYTIDFCIGSVIGDIKEPGPLTANKLGIISGGGSSAPLASCLEDTTGCSWNSLGDTRFTSGGASNPFIVMSNNITYIAYADEDDGYKAKVMKYENSSWQLLGDTGVYDGDIAFQVDNGVPYLAYSNKTNSSRANVIKYVNGSWTAVGSVDFTSASAAYISLAITSGTPYVSYQDGAQSGKLSVKTFNGTNWVQLGSAGLSDGGVNYSSINIYNGIPYVVYGDISHTGKATMKKYENSAWTNVGSTSFSSGSAIVINSYINNGVPYVVYIDDNDNNTIMKYENSSWQQVGSSLYSFNNINPTLVSLSFYNNVPYIAYADGANNGKITFAKLSNNTWTNIGSAGFSPNIIDTRLVMNGETPYVVYQEQGDSNKGTVIKFNR